MLLVLTTLIAASPKNANKTSRPHQQPELCDCKRSVNDIQPSFFISAIDDSVVICDTHKVNAGSGIYNNYVDFLKHTSLGAYGNIVACPTKKTFELKGFNFALHYQDRKLIVASILNYDVYDEKTGNWQQLVQKRTYEQTIYAEAGVLKIGEAKMVLNAPVYSAKAIELVHKMYDDDVIINNPRASKYQLIRRLLGAALSGDEISAEQLVNYSKLISPNNDSKQVLKAAVGVWQDYKAAHKLK